MEKLIITEKEVGTEYLLALKEIVKIRKDRRSVYGDGWKDNPIDYDVWNIYGKVTRAIHILKQGDNSYEKLIDTLKDCVNYSIFATWKSLNSQDVYNKQVKKR